VRVGFGILIIGIFIFGSRFVARNSPEGSQTRRSSKVLPAYDNELPLRPESSGIKFKQSNSSHSLITQTKELVQELEDKDWDWEQMQELAGDLAPEEFEQHLEPELSARFKRIRLSIEESIPEILKSDGENIQNLEPTPIEVAPWIAQRKQELDSLELRQDIHGFVETLNRAPQITDEDLNQLVFLCNQEKDCVEKAVVEWMDHNHLFSASQLAFLEKGTR